MVLLYKNVRNACKLKFPKKTYHSFSRRCTDAFLLPTPIERCYLPFLNNYELIHLQFLIRTEKSWNIKIKNLRTTLHSDEVLRELGDVDQFFDET